MTQDLHVNFSSYFTKLRVPNAFIFPTIRAQFSWNYGKTLNKDEYYIVGKTYKINIMEVHEFNGLLLNKIHYKQGKDIPDEFLRYDTDNNQEWIDKIKKYKETLLLLFEKKAIANDI